MISSRSCILSASGFFSGFKDSRVLHRSRRPAMGMLFAGLLSVAAACASASGAQTYPEPPDVGSAEMRQMLRRVARDALSESDPSRRVAKLLELQARIDQAARSTEDPAKARDEFSRFLVGTFYVTIAKGDHSRGKGGIGYMPNDVTDMPERVPQELVALRMTAPRHWIEDRRPAYKSRWRV